MPASVVVSQWSYVLLEGSKDLNIQSSSAAGC